MLPEGGRFCATCGFDLQARSDERRVVTVLFGDLVGFTSLAETADPESVKHLVDRAFERLVRDIIAFGGRVDKIVGDAIVALFGAPVAHEDDPERAVRAGLAMQETLLAYRAEAGGDIHMRIGINTGEVLTGAMRAGGDYTAMGDVVNTASRLQQAASPGEVLVGPATYEASRSAITYEPRGLLAARGREAPVETWAASEVVMLPGRQPRRRRAPLLGRDAELSLLRQSLRLASTHRRASLVLLLGDSGVGKTRLADELADWACRELGAERVDGRCVPYGEANIWYPMGSALRMLCDVAEDATADEARDAASASVRDTLPPTAPAGLFQQIVEALLHLMGYETPLRNLEPLRAREEAGRALMRFFEARTVERPLIVRLADLHWADDLLLGLVDDLLTQLTRSPFILIAGARHLLDPRWSPRSGRYNHIVLNLDPLDRAAAESLVDQLAGLGTISSAHRDTLIARSGGNPFFLEELVALTLRSQAEEGADPAEQGGRARAPRSASSDLPETLRGLVAARLDYLLPDERAVLEDAAVFGSSGPIGALGVMAERSGAERQWKAALYRLADRELLDINGGRWSFRSDLVREVAYGTLTKTDRAQRHAEIAHWMEHNLGSVEPEDSVVNRIARHYSTAAFLSAEVGSVDRVPPDLRERALQWLGEAARRAQLAEIHVMASRLYSSALELAGSDASPQRLAFLLGRADARHGLAELDAALRDVNAATAVAIELDDRRGLARTLLVRAEIEQRRNQFEASSAALAEALEISRALGDRQGEAEALRQQGMANLFAGNYTAAEQSTSEALAIFRSLEDRRGEAWALQNLAWAAYLSGRVGEAETRIGDSAATFAELGDTGGLAWANGLLAFTRFHQGQLAESEKLAEELLPDARDRGDRFGEAMMLLVGALSRLWSGRTEQAVERAEACRAVFSRMGDGLGQAQADAVLGRAQVAVGNIAGGFDVLDRLAARSTTRRGEPGDTIGHLSLALAALSCGDPERAAPALERVPVDPQDSSLGTPERVVAHALAALQTGRTDAALRLLGPGTDPNESPAILAVLALARMAAGDASGALVAADRAHESTRATYLDLVFAYVAAGLAYAERADTSEVIAAFAAARQEVDATGDLVAQAIVRQAEAAALGAVGATSARSVRREAERRLDALGLAAEGWSCLFQAARQSRPGPVSTG